MTGNQSRGGMAIAALVLAIVAIVVLLITFRGLWFVALPLALIALGLAVLSGSGKPTRGALVSGYVALLLALIAVTGAGLATFADLSIGRDYDVYETVTETVSSD